VAKGHWHASHGVAYHALATSSGFDRILRTITGFPRTCTCLQVVYQYGNAAHTIRGRVPTNGKVPVGEVSAELTKGWTRPPDRSVGVTKDEADDTGASVHRTERRFDASQAVAGLGSGEFTAAIEQVTESVIITDRDPRITYVNPSFERVTGYSRDEVIGQNPRLLKSGFQTPSFYVAMWAAITSGSAWSADFVNRRKDGTLFTEEAVISPIRDPSGAITSFVAVQRDVTNERELVDRSTQLARQRALIAETIRGLRAGDTPEATAQAICRQVVNFTGIAAAHLSLFDLDGRTQSIGFVVLGQPDPPLERLPSRRSYQLRQRAARRGTRSHLAGTQGGSPGTGRDDHWIVR
jgi:PAS domain S-box-containing protein